jgi:four helix bundle protein
MGRLQQKLVDRVDDFAVRALEVAEAIEGMRVTRRIVDQLAGSGSSVGANLAEADEAMSNRDFFKCIGTCLKETNETRFWLRIIARKGWVRPRRLDALRAEADELKRIFGAIVKKPRSAR